MFYLSRTIASLLGGCVPLRRYMIFETVTLFLCSTLVSLVVIIIIPSHLDLLTAALLHLFSLCTSLISSAEVRLLPLHVIGSLMRLCR